MGVLGKGERPDPSGAVLCCIWVQPTQISSICPLEKGWGALPCDPPCTAPSYTPKQVCALLQLHSSARGEATNASASWMQPGKSHWGTQTAVTCSPETPHSAGERMEAANSHHRVGFSPVAVCASRHLPFLRAQGLCLWCRASTSCHCRLR